MIAREDQCSVIMFVIICLIFFCYCHHDELMYLFHRVQTSYHASYTRLWLRLDYYGPPALLGKYKRPVIQQNKSCLVSNRRNQPSVQPRVHFASASIREYYPMDKPWSSHPTDSEVKLDDWEFQRWQEKVTRTDKRLPRRRFISDETRSLTKAKRKNSRSIEYKLKMLSPRRLWLRNPSFPRR
jgi:hypothetical protein